MSTPSRIAVHEAGHAIAALYFGLKVFLVRLFDRGVDRGGSGMTLGYMLSPEKLGEVEPFHWVCVLLAGRAAERELCRGLTPAQRDEMATKDLEDAVAWTEACDPEQPERLFRRADATARIFAEQHRALNRALACELDRRRVLYGDELIAFVAQHQQQVA